MLVIFSISKYLYFFRGGYESSCVNGHVGPLCSSCEIYGPLKFTKDVGNVCSLCIDDGENAVKILFIGFTLGILLVWIIRSLKINH